MRVTSLSVFRLGLSWKVLARRVFYEIGKDDVFGRSAELAYFFLLSVFPLLLVISSLLGMLSEGAQIRYDLLRYFGTVMPFAAFELVSRTLDEITAASGGGKLSAGILITLASASSGMVAIIEGLNSAYEVREVRPWWRRRLVAIVLTLALAILTISALAIVLYGNLIASWAADRIGLGSAFRTVWAFAQWPVVAVFVILALVVVYRFAPNVKGQKWHWIVPGAVVAFFLWLIASVGLRLYLMYFNTYNKFYGSLGALIILMLWFYLFGVAILVGGEVNSVIENAAARAGDPEAKLPGERAPGEPAAH